MMSKDWLWREGAQRQGSVVHFEQEHTKAPNINVKAVIPGHNFRSKLVRSALALQQPM